MPYVDPATVQNPTTGVAISSSWGDQVNENFSFLHTTKPMCRVNATGAQTIDSTVTALTFDQERFDNASMHSTSSNTSRITMPIDGVYLVGGSMWWANTDTDGHRDLYLRVNGSIVIAIEQAKGDLDLSGMSISTLWAFTAGQYVELAVFQNSGSSIDTVVSSSCSPEFWAVWQGAL